MSVIDCPKCGEEHEPIGSHEEDSGEHECENCGFKFVVTIEYDPEYYSRCVTHEYGEWKPVPARGGEIVTARFCGHCGACELSDELKREGT